MRYDINFGTDVCNFILELCEFVCLDLFLYVCLCVRLLRPISIHLSVLLFFYSLSKSTVAGKKNLKLAELPEETPFVAMVTRQLAEIGDRLSCRDLKAMFRPSRSLSDS